MTAELKMIAATGAHASDWKPYPAYKDSGVEWLGKVPEHWEVKRLKWISYINPVKSNSKFDKNSEDLVTFLPMEKVSEDGKIDIEIKKPIKDLWNGFTYFEENDIIVAKITPCFENGKGALIKNLGSKVGFGSTEFHVLRPKENIIKELLYYLTKSDIFMKLGEASMTGAAGQKRVTNSFLEDFFICYPKDIGKQKSISLFLDDRTRKIDSLIEKKQKMIELLKEERAAVINQAVTKGLNPDAPMKDSGIEWLGEVPEHWKVKKLKYVAEVVLGKMLTSDDKGGYFYKPYLRAQNIGCKKLMQMI
ncbi:MAG: type I restriction-modification system specificity subunit [Candidatus Methanoperedens nitroreducens]|uniref:Type I restriction-modification system specificity subunit n=1 Tax=Candidatus Methanoperedens nitratireducens TaxID=1392998 RepID=A0A0P7ZF15_9EURY|nr:MAG: type I restriction-modification system specificity subunit [Candidatus Methanoperedens sp. BLZ1]